MSRSDNKPSQPFASASLVALAIRALRALDINLLPADVREPDHFADAMTEASTKADILAYAYEKGGALPLLTVGRTLEEMKKFPFTPVFMKSVDCNVLASKWMRLEVFHHSAHRVVIDSGVPGTWSCRRKWKGAKPPTDAENLFICGIMAGLLSLYGCRDVIASIGGIRFSDETETSSPVFPSKDTLSWQFHWSGVGPKPKDITSTDSAPNPKADPNTVSSYSEQLIYLFAQDMGRVWKLDEAAQALNRSPRSLQRSIKDGGHSFSSLVRKARSVEACKLLAGTDMALSTIGYGCGYSDQAHFQRDFRRALNMTPLQYRKINLSEE